MHFKLKDTHFVLPSSTETEKENENSDQQQRDHHDRHDNPRRHCSKRNYSSEKSSTLFILCCTDYILTLPRPMLVQRKNYFHLLVLFNILHKLVLTFKSVDETPLCDHSNEIYWAVLSCGTVYYAAQGGSNFTSVDETPACDHSSKIY